MVSEDRNEDRMPEREVSYTHGQQKDFFQKKAAATKTNNIVYGKEDGKGTWSNRIKSLERLWQGQRLDTLG